MNYCRENRFFWLWKPYHICYLNIWCNWICLDWIKQQCFSNNFNHITNYFIERNTSNTSKKLQKKYYCSLKKIQANNKQQQKTETPLLIKPQTPPTPLPHSFHDHHCVASCTLFDNELTLQSTLLKTWYALKM